eukprot:TRINITY_DN85225_c0_g1_i1.p1 TRINITY_DN85225_c0_g1~~TRINITY_DN85225_c0_g1_i1.p1  ORF type:complete len:179 (+),score=31.67 TRINITY_DN85225_c0_g1_i1:31-537(+)
MANAVEKKIAELGLTIPEAVPPVASYVPWRRAGSTVYISGQIPKHASGMHTGKLGADLKVEDGQEAARTCAMNIIAQVKAACDGDLSKVQAVLRLEGFVNSTPDFVDHPKVINGASDLICEVFGKEVGSHSRFAVGCNSLPLGVSVEIGAVVELQDEAGPASKKARTS